MQNILLSFLKRLLIIVAALFALYFSPWNNIMVILGLLLVAMVLSEIIIWAVWAMMHREFEPNLSNKAVLITGCDSGFGNGLARTLDKKGVTVYAGCLFPEGEGAMDLKNSCSNKLKVLQLDVTKDDHVQRALESVSRSLGDKELGAIVNNAGIASVAEVEWCPLEVYQKTMEVNALGPVRVTRAFLPLLRKSQGRVVIVASYLGRVTISGTSAYSMSKHAAISLADSLRRELIKWSISVHTIEPWLYRTSLVSRETIFNGIDKQWQQLTPDIQAAYSENYLDKFKVAIKNILESERPSSAIGEVVDDMEHAAIGKNPKSRYIPGPVGQIWVWLRICTPEELMDYLMCKIFPSK